jgi:PBP1b-binding outer membrane lipoprotein LpoB
MIVWCSVYQKKYWLTVLILIALIFLFLPGCSKTDQGAAPKKSEAPAPAKVEAPVKPLEPAKAEVPPKVQEPLKAQESAKVQGGAVKPPKKEAPQKAGSQELNPDYNP